MVRNWLMKDMKMPNCLRIWSTIWSNVGRNWKKRSTTDIRCCYNQKMPNRLVTLRHSPASLVYSFEEKKKKCMIVLLVLIRCWRSWELDGRARTVSHDRGSWKRRNFLSEFDEKTREHGASGRRLRRHDQTSRRDCSSTYQWNAPGKVNFIHFSQN